MKKLTNKIAFSELKNYNDTNSFVWLAMLIPTAQAKIKATCNEMSEWLFKEGFITKGKVIELKRIAGNTTCRSDVLVIFSKDCSGLHPLKRLKTDDMKWTSDFIVNYAKDYDVIEYEEYDENYD